MSQQYLASNPKVGIPPFAIIISQQVLLFGYNLTSGPDFLIICLSPVDGNQTAITSEIMIV